MKKQTISDKKMKQWDLHMFLSKEIVIGIDFLLKKQCGYPNGMTMEEWNDILKKIRDGFEIYYDSDGDFWEWKNGKSPPYQPNIKNDDGTWTCPPTPKGYKLIINKKKKKAFNDAFKLLHKHFEHLWD